MGAKWDRFDWKLEIPINFKLKTEVTQIRKYLVDFKIIARGGI